MFSNIAYQEPLHTGKRTSGMQTKKNNGSILSWDVSQNMNQYQRNKAQGKAKQVTGKVYGATLNPQSERLPSQHQQQLDPQTALRIEYERIIRENPNISQEELDILLYQFQRRQQEKPRVVAQEVLAPTQSYGNYDRRTPVKPNQSAKGIIYGGYDNGANNQRRTASRRNNSNLVLGDGYNYFKDVKK